MNRIVLPFALFCGGLASGAAAGTGHGLQPTGHFHGGEAVARQGERWLALRMDGDGAELRAVRASVTRVHDAIVDGEGEATGDAVSAIGLEDATMLLRGPGLAPRRVTLASARDDGDPAAATQRLALGGREYRIATRCARDPANDRDSMTAHVCTIELHEGARRQTLATIPGHLPPDTSDPRVQLGDDASPHLVFAGDLDGDGRLDLIFDTTDHYNLSRPTLFLSGIAGRNALVRAVASHSAVGC